MGCEELGEYVRCVWLGAAWMRGLDLGFTKPVVTVGELDACLCFGCCGVGGIGVGGIGGEWVGGLVQCLEGWGGVMSV